MTIPALSGLLLFLAITVLMIVEAKRAATNERWQLSRGGVEPSGDVYRLMRIAYPGIFVAMLAESVVRGAPIAASSFAAGLALFAVAKALKWWAILTLGHDWTFRVIVVPDSASVATGPYRFLRHPNYVGVVGEIVGVALMTGAFVTGPLALIVFGTLLRRRIAVENRARDAILRRN